MDTLKTAIVVILLLAVLYGVYVTLNQPDADFAEDVAWEQQQTVEPLQVEFDGAVGEASNGVKASLGDSAPWSSEPAGATMHDHDHTMASAAASTETAVDDSYRPPPKPAALAAPDLITTGSASPASATSSTTGTNEYSLSAPAIQSGGAAGFESNPGPPAGNPNSSVYAAEQAEAGTPTGSYGDTSVLTQNPHVVATTEPAVGDSYAEPTAPNSSVAPQTRQATQNRISGVLETAKGQVERGEHYEALYTLSLAYDSPGVSVEESQQLQQWLDPLAGKVIYSNEHLIDKPYQIQPGETLQSVATKHRVPWQLLANINGLSGPAAAQPGTSIKVVPGPFRAEIDVNNGSLTLFAGRLYAGRFSINVNQGNVPPAGEYQVNDKQPGHSFYGGNAQTLGPDDPQNPYGGIWIDLGGNVSLHATSSTPGQSERLGCISLANRDANDLYGILSLGSSVVIR